MSYSNIDITKLFMAFCVVAIHVAKLSNYTLPPVVDFTVRLAVPFFLVVSGYFLYPKLFDHNNKGRGHVLLKYLKMYVVWTLVYLPFAVLYYYRASYSVTDAAVEYFNNFLFTGETPLAWHMWYMHTLIVSVFLLWLLSYTRLGIELFSAIVLFVALSLDVINAFDIHVLDPIVSWVGDGQNFVLTGLPALCLVILSKKHNDHFVKNAPPIQTAITYSICEVLCVLLYVLDLQIYCILFSGFIFLLLINLPQMSGKTSIWRECSKYVYFLHLLIAFMLRGRFESVYVYWFVVVCATMILSIALYYLRGRLRIIHA